MSAALNTASRLTLSFPVHAQAALADARAEARRLLASAHEEAEPLPLPQTARQGRGSVARQRSTSPHSAPLPPARPPWERWTSPARARRAGSEPPSRRGRSAGGAAAPPFAAVTPVRLDYWADEEGRPAHYGRHSAARHDAIPLGATSAERAAAVMSVRRATRASAARARAETYAHVREVR